MAHAGRVRAGAGSEWTVVPRRVWAWFVEGMYEQGVRATVLRVQAVWGRGVRIER